MTNLTNMEEITKKLQGENASRKDRWVKAKAGWLNYKHCSKKENLLEKIEKYVEVHPTRKKKGLRKLVQNTKISEDRIKSLSKNKKSEVVLERQIVRANNDIFNQLCVGKGNVESIDLIYSDNKINKKWLIEFKTTSNTPLYGFIEIIKNYCLLKKISNEDADKVERLILLAPKTYFIQFKEEKSITEFYKTIAKFNDTSKLCFLICYIDLDYKDLEQIELIPLNKFKKEKWKELSEDEWINFK